MNLSTASVMDSPIMFPDDVVDVAAGEDALAHAVEDGALLVGDFVVFEEVFAGEEVSFLDFFWARRIPLLMRLSSMAMPSSMPRKLRTFDGPLAGEHLHQVVLEGDVEATGAGIALAAGAAAELVVDAARGVALGADDVEAAGGGGFGGEFGCRCRGRPLWWRW